MPTLITIGSISGKAFGFGASGGILGSIYSFTGGNKTVSKATLSGVTTSPFLTLSTGIGAIASDATGNIYICTNNNTLSKISASGVLTENWASIGTNTQAITIVQSSGNIYCGGNYGINKVTPSGTVTFFYTGNSLQNITSDASGNVYFGTGNNVVSKLTPSGTYTATWATVSCSYFYNFATDSSGNVYTLNNTRALAKITPAGVVTNNWSSVSYPCSFIAVDTSGNVYVDSGYSGNYGIVKISPSGSANLTWSTGYPKGPSGGIVFDSLGNIYTGVNHNIIKVDTSGTANLSWAVTSGEINGITSSPV